MNYNNEILFAVFDGDRELTPEAYKEVLDFTAFVQSQKAAVQSKDCK